MDNITLKQAIGQMFMVGIAGTQSDEHFSSIVGKWDIGNVILFARNLQHARQARQLTAQLQDTIQQTTSYPAFIGADQEGGIVLRLINGATAFPGNMAVGATNNEQFALQVAYAMGQELLSVGINMNLAPVLDINNNPKNPVIGVRSFGSTVEHVTRFGRAALAGYQKAGIACIAKHFPGHGDTTVDSHTGLPIIHHSLNQLHSRELQPFAAAMRDGIDGVMTAHIAFPHIDREPATLSQRIMTELVRNELGFDGLIITDSMRMAGVAKQYGYGEAAVKAIQAGCDILLYSAMDEAEEEAIAAVHKAVQQGVISEERIYASAQRIIRAKKRLLQEDCNTSGNLSAHQKLALQVSRSAITCIRDHGANIPLTADQPVTFVETKRRAITQVEDQITTHGLQHQLTAFFPQAKYVAVGFNPDENEIQAAYDRIPPHHHVVIVTQDAWRHKGQYELLEVLAKRGYPALIHVAARLPYDVHLVPSIETALCTYDTVPATIQALLEVLSGQIETHGSNPLLHAMPS